ncbi:hypothetical protein [Acidiphilium acidophilum]|nr:hypothetical protein [Acidiphilium acidophilum]
MPIRFEPSIDTMLHSDVSSGLIEAGRWDRLSEIHNSDFHRSAIAVLP